MVFTNAFSVQVIEHLDRLIIHINTVILFDFKDAKIFLRIVLMIEVKSSKVPWIHYSFFWFGALSVNVI